MSDGGSGWVKLWRAADGCPALQACDAEGVWSKMLRKAAHKPTKVNWKGKTVHLETGQLCISIRGWARDGELSHKRMRTIFERFEREGMVSSSPISVPGRGTGTGTVGVLVTICNYAEYQLLDDNRGTGMGTGKGTVGAHQGHTEQEAKNLRTDSERKNQRPNGRSLTPLTAEINQLEPKAASTRDMLAVWNRVCGDILPQARGAPGKTRQQRMLARFVELERSLERWELVCQRVRASQFLTGQASTRNGSQPFMASLDWVVAPSNFAKVLEGNYDDRKSGAETIEQWAARLAQQHLGPHGHH